MVFKSCSLLAVVAVCCNAADLLSFATATTRYRTFDWARQWNKHLVTDVNYLGTAANNEIYAGAGYVLKLASFVEFTPFVYVVAGTTGNERGLGFGATAAVSIRKGQGVFNLTHFVPISGSVRAYNISDASTITRTVSKNWETGLMFTVFQEPSAILIFGGPLIRKNDKLGAWTLSFEAGSQNQIRLQRTFQWGR